MVRPRTVREPRGAWQYLWREGLGARNQHGQHSDDDHPHETVGHRRASSVRNKFRARRRAPPARRLTPGPARRGSESRPTSNNNNNPNNNNNKQPQQPQP